METTFENQILAYLAESQKDLKEIRNRLNQIQPIKFGWLDPGDVCGMLHICKRTLENYRLKKLIPYSTIGGKYFYRREDIEEILQKNMVRKEEWL